MALLRSGLENQLDLVWEVGDVRITATLLFTKVETVLLFRDFTESSKVLIVSIRRSRLLSWGNVWLSYRCFGFRTDIDRVHDWNLRQGYVDGRWLWIVSIPATSSCFSLFSVWQNLELKTSTTKHGKCLNECCWPLQETESDWLDCRRLFYSSASSRLVQTLKSQWSNCVNKACVPSMPTTLSHRRETLSRKSIAGMFTEI